MPHPQHVIITPAGALERLDRANKAGLVHQFVMTGVEGASKAFRWECDGQEAFPMMIYLRPDGTWSAAIDIPDPGAES